MLLVFVFTFISAALVHLAGRRDVARDPRLSVLLLALLVVFPVLCHVMPKLEVMPEMAGGEKGAGFPWQKVLFGMWAVGFLIRLARLAWAGCELTKWHSRSRLIEKRGPVEIRLLEGLRGPVAAGVFRPMIYVPSSWDGLSEKIRQVVLAHEMAHHQRRDPLWRLMAEMACAVHWYHPAVHWMAHRLAEQCEYACDAVVIKKGISPKVYAQVLCDFADGGRMSGPALAMAEASSLENRVRRIITVPRSHRKGATMALGVFIFLGLTAATLLSMLGTRSAPEAVVPQQEVRLRLSADPFPGN